MNFIYDLFVTLIAIVFYYWLIKKIVTYFKKKKNNHPVKSPEVVTKISHEHNFSIVELPSKIDIDIIINNERIFKESINIIMSTVNIKTFLSRCDVLSKFENLIYTYLQKGLITLSVPFDEIISSVKRKRHIALSCDKNYRDVFYKLTKETKYNVCPSCGCVLENPVKRQKKCPDCSNMIYILKADNEYYTLINSDQKHELESTLIPFTEEQTTGDRIEPLY